jgi:cellobiose phosphorylase
LGVKPDYFGIYIDPCIPANWKDYSMSRKFRNKNLHISVCNPNAKQTGVDYMLINGEKILGNYIPFDTLKDVNVIEVHM